MPYNLLKHGQHYKMRVKWTEAGDSILHWCQRVVQDHATKLFSAQVWDPKNDFKYKTNKILKPNR